MPKKPERKPDDPEQYKRFLEAAKEAEADVTEKVADTAFRKVARVNASKSVEKKGRAKST